MNTGSLHYKSATLMKKKFIISYAKAKSEELGKPLLEVRLISEPQDHRVCYVDELNCTVPTWSKSKPLASPGGGANMWIEGEWQDYDFERENGKLKINIR